MYMSNLKYATSEYNKKEAFTHRYTEQTGSCQWAEWMRERQKVRVGDLEVQTIRYKIIYKDVLCNMGNIANIL